MDLAWGSRNGSGLCAVEDGRVLDSACLRSDDEIVGWIRRWDTDELLVAFDAPLIVVNAEGCRGCELVVGAGWGAAHASCYPANRGRPAFASGGRAVHLAQRLQLRTDPHAIGRPPVRVGIEVYPHSALVSLFNLEVVLKYKAGRTRGDHGARRRTVAERCGEFRRLVQCLLDLRERTPSLDVTASPGWKHLVAHVDSATTGAQLDRMEDELDAYVCAYVGLHYESRHGQSDSLVIGDGGTGYIVTPVDAMRRPHVERAAAKYGVAIA